MIYASLGLALVLIYRTTNIANFAQGEMATFSAFLVWQVLAFGLPLWLAFIVAMVLSAIMGFVLYVVLVRPVQYKDELTIIIVTLGFFLAFNSASGAIWGFLQKSVPSLFPSGVLFSAASVRIRYDFVGSAILLLIIALGMYLIFQKTRIGLALRAAASNATSAKLIGIPFLRMMAIGWGLAAVLGAISGMLVAPKLTLDPNMMLTVIIYAFAAAVVGGLSSYKGAVVGGMLVGVSQALSIAYLPWLGSDLAIVVPLVLIMIILIYKPEGLFGSTVVDRV